MIPTLSTAEGYLQIQLRGTRAVYLVLPIKDVELDVTSSDLAFERETDDRTLGVDSVRQGGRVIERRYRQSPLGDGLVAEVVVRDGKLYRSFEPASSSRSFLWKSVEDRQGQLDSGKKHSGRMSSSVGSTPQASGPGADGEGPPLKR